MAFKQCLIDSSLEELDKKELQDKIKDLKNSGINNTDAKESAIYSMQEEFKELINTIEQASTEEIPSIVLEPKATNNNNRSLIDSVKESGKFLDLNVSFVDSIEANRDKAVAAKVKDNNVLINEALLREKFKQKAWTKPATLHDDTRVTPIPIDMFEDFDDFFRFVMLHENAHTYIKKNDEESFGHYEDSINHEALMVMGKDTSYLDGNYFADVQSDLLKHSKDLMVQLPLTELDYLNDLAEELNTDDTSVYYEVFREGEFVHLEPFAKNLLPSTIEAIQVRGEITPTQKVDATVKQFSKRLKNLFKGINIISIPQSDVSLYSDLPPTEVKSFVIGNNVYLVEGQFDPEDLIEELLHPIVLGIKNDNPEIFQEYYSQIKDKYSEIEQLYNSKGLMGDVEIVTKALRDRLKVPNSNIFERLWNFIRDIFNYLTNTNKALPKTIDELGNNLISGGFNIKRHFTNNIQYSISSSQPYSNQISQAEIVKNLLSFATNNGVTKLPEGQLVDGRRYVDKNGKGLKSTTEIIKEKNDELFKNAKQSVIDSIDFEMLKEDGILAHKAVEDIINRLTDPVTKTLRPSIDGVKNVPQGFPEDAYNSIEAYLTGLLNSYEEGTVFLSETVVFHPITRVASTIDFIAITPQSKIHVFDWKFIKKPTGKEDDVLKDWKQSNYNYQLTSYRDMIMQATGVGAEAFERVRIQPFIRVEKKEKVDGRIVFDLANVLTPYTGGPAPAFNKQLSFKSQAEYEPINELREFFAKFRNFVSLDTKKRNLDSNVNYFVDDKDLRSDIENAINLVSNTNNLDAIFDLHEKLYEEAKDMKDSLLRETKDLSEIDASNHKHTFEKLVLMNEMINSIDSFRSIAKSIFPTFGREDSNKSEEQTALETKLFAFENKIIGLKNDFEELNRTILIKAGRHDGYLDISEEELGVSGMQHNFTFFTQAQTRTASFLGKMFTKYFPKITMLVNNKVLEVKDKQDKVQKLGRQRGQSLREIYLNMVDTQGFEKNPRLKSIFSADFFSDQEEILATKDLDKVKDFYEKYYDMDTLRDINNKKIQERLDNIDKMDISDSEKTYKKERVYFIYDFDSSITPFKNLTLSKLKRDNNGEHVQEFRDKYYTEFGKSLIDPANADIRSLYNTFIKINEEAANSGFIPYNQVYSFIPNITKGLIEKGAKSTKGLFKAFTDKFKVIPDAGLYGKLDPSTNLPVKEVFCPFTADFFNGDYTQKSLDLGVVYTEFFAALQRAKAAQELQPLAESLKSLEERKKIIETTDSGLAKRLFKGLGFLKTNKKANLEYLEMFVDAGIYGEGIQDSFDRLYTNDKGDTYSLRKGLNNVVQYMYMNTFAANPFTAIRNMMGGLFSSVFTSGRHFLSTDILSVDTFWKAATTTINKMDEESTIVAALLGKYLPLINNQLDRKTVNLSMNELTKWVNPDFIMALQNKSESIVQVSVAVALLKNTIVLNGNLVNVNEHVKELYPDKYNGINNPKDIQALRDKARRDLMKTTGLLQLATIKDGKLEVPNISEDSITKFVNLAQYYQSKATGQNPDWNTIGYKRYMLGRLAGMYKNWIPRTVQARLGNFKYNSQLDGYEWGRWLDFGNAVRIATKGSYLNGVKTFLGFGNKEQLVEHAKETYLKYLRESRETKTDFQKFLSEEEFIEEYMNNVNNSIKELYMMSFMTILLASALLAPDDDDSEEERAAKSFARFQLDRLKDEFTFYINPSSFGSIAGSPFPIISFFNNLLKIPMWEVPKQILGFGADQLGFEFGEKWMESAHPIKHILKSIPVFSEFSKYLTFLYPELAKDLGIRPVTIRNF